MEEDMRFQYKEKRWEEGRESSKNVKKKNNVGNLHIVALMWVNHGENHDPAIS